VAAKMAVMAPSTVQLDIFTWNKKLTRFLKDGQPEMLNKCNKKE
jgi:hypothetical protein